MKGRVGSWRGRPGEPRRAEGLRRSGRVAGASQASRTVQEGCGGGHGPRSLPSGPSRGLPVSQQVAADSIPSLFILGKMCLPPKSSQLPTTTSSKTAPKQNLVHKCRGSGPDSSAWWPDISPCFSLNQLLLLFFILHFL